MILSFCYLLLHIHRFIYLLLYYFFLFFYPLFCLFYLFLLVVSFLVANVIVLIFISHHFQYFSYNCLMAGLLFMVIKTMKSTTENVSSLWISFVTCSCLGGFLRMLVICHFSCAYIAMWQLKNVFYIKIYLNIVPYLLKFITAPYQLKSFSYSLFFLNLVFYTQIFVWAKLILLVNLLMYFLG